MIFTEKYKIGMEDIGINNAATNKAIIAIMEDVGSLHSATVGFGVYDIDTKHRAWVLLDWQVKIINRPMYDDVVDASTWSRKFDRACAYRDFELKNENGEVMAIGTSRWLLMDTDRRRPVRLTEELSQLYETEVTRMVFEYEIEPMQLEVPDAFTEDMNVNEMDYKVQRRDIDMNLHMHNINYIDVANELIPFEIYTQEQLDNIRITYKKEIRFGDVIRCIYTYEDGKHTVRMVSEDKVHAVIQMY